MTVSPEQLAAFADHQLEGAEARAVAAEVAADPVLQAQVEAHRALRERLAGHFAPIAAAEVPERLLAAARAPARSADVIDLSVAAAARKRGGRPGISWRYAMPAIAASLVAAVLGVNAWQSRDYAGGAVGVALDHQLAATAPADASVRVLLSFRDGAGQFCRAYAAGNEGGIACRDDRGWRLQFRTSVPAGQQAEFRQAGSGAAAVMAAAQTMAVGPALSADEEATAAKRNWHR